MADWVEVGSKAPAFTLKDQDNAAVKLSDFKGSPVILYFYPKDDTPGCTKEACAFQDALKKIASLGAVVLGISPDSPESHRKFREKYDLSFVLLSDPDHAVAEKFGAWREKNMYGKKVMGIQRSTFLIGRDGKIKRAWPKVSVDGHVEQVIAALREAADLNE